MWLFASSDRTRIGRMSSAVTAVIPLIVFKSIEDSDVGSDRTRRQAENEQKRSIPISRQETALNYLNNIDSHSVILNEMSIHADVRSNKYYP